MFRHIVFAVIFAFSVLAILPMQAGALSQGLNVFLNQYISQGAINNSTFVNQSVSNNTYIIMQVPTGQTIVINSTKGFSLVMSNVTAYNALRTYLLSKYAPNATTINLLNSYLLSFQRTAAPPLTDCITETGLKNNACTVANACYSCLTVPNCNTAMSQTGGPTGVLGEAIANFSIVYAQLNASYNAYDSAIAKITPNTTYQDMLVLQQAVKNISYVSSVLPQNPLFPLPQGFNPSTLAGCPAVPVASSPWYCKSLGYCQYLKFNQSSLYNMQAEITNIMSEPISNSSIMAFAKNSTLSAKAFLQPVEVKSFVSLLAYYYPKYNATLLNSTLLLGSFYNNSLSAKLSRLESTFTQLASYNLSMNASEYNATLSQEFRNVSLEYSSLNSMYSVLKSNAANTTAIVLQKELDYQIEPPSLAAVAYMQQRLNNKIVSGIKSSEYSNISSTLQGIKGKIAGIGTPISMAALVKGIDGGFIGGIFSKSTAQIQSNLASGPLYAALLSLAIAAILIIGFYFASFHRLGKKQRLHLHKAAKRAWMILFIILAIIGLAYVYMTYSYAASANNFLPVSGFIKQMDSHSSIVIAQNGSIANASILQCESALEETFKSFNKSVSTLTMKNYTCVGSSNSNYSASPYCFNQIMSAGTPIIVISQSQNSSIIYKGIYGHALYASGNAASGSACYLNAIFKVH